MNKKDVKVGGCCFGIPFGCGTLLLVALVVGGAAGSFPLSVGFFLSAAAWIAAGVAFFAGAVIAAEWLRELRGRRLLPPA